MLRLSLACLIGLTIAGCNVQQAPGENAATAAAPGGADADAARIVGEAHAAYAAGDTQRIADLYAPGAVAFDPSHRESTGDRAMLTKWAADFVLMKPADVISRPTIQPIGPDGFVASGIMSFTADVGGNRQLLNTRYSQVFQRQPDGRWLIVHEHMSMPPTDQPG